MSFMVAISPFAFFFFSFFFFCALLFLTPCLLLTPSCSHAKERSLKDYRHSCKCFRIIPTFSSFDIRLADAPVGVWIGVRWLTNIVFIVGMGDLIIDILPI